MAKYTDKGRVPSTSRVAHHDTKGPSKPKSKESRRKRGKELSDKEKQWQKLMIKGALRKKEGGYNKKLTSAQLSRLGIKKRSKTKDD